MTIYFLNPSGDGSIWGGVQKLYEYSHILDEAGLDAAVINLGGFKGHWFSTRAKTRTPPVRLLPEDLLVVPESLGESLRTIAPGHRRVSLNQNSFQMFDGVAEPSRHPYVDNPDLVSVITISKSDRLLVSSAFPDLRVDLVPLRIDADQFRFRPGDRPRRVAFMPRKRVGQSTLILRALRMSGALEGWEITKLEGLSHAQVADELGQCRLFLSFAEREGFGLPGAEALAVGCSVLGYSGIGGDEYMRGSSCTVVPEDDQIAFLEAATSWLNANPWNEEEARSASEAVLSSYDAETERRALISAFSSAVDSVARSARVGNSDSYVGVEHLVRHKSRVRRVAIRARTRVDLARR